MIQAKQLGPVSCLKLLDLFDTPQNIVAAPVEDLLLAGLSRSTIETIKHPDESTLQACLEWLDKPHHHLITCFDPDYPALLKTIHDAPPVLFAAGYRAALTAVQFAIVGSRNPTASGRSIAQEFACELSNTGFSICSGLALGIDYHSHLGALDASGITVAVLGNGLEKIYPARHKKVAEQIMERGLLVSEFPPGTKPVPGNFPRRNRIISGLSTGVLVVEAARRSGSLITARYALEQGRDVFAIPGSIHNPLARGTNYLIKQGAKLVETVADIVEELGTTVSWALHSGSMANNSQKHSDKLEDEYEILLDAMGFDEIGVDELVKSSGLTADAVSSMLLIMELQGLVEPRHGGRYCRRA